MRFDNLLHAYFDEGRQLKYGLPSVQYCADRLCVRKVVIYFTKHFVGRHKIAFSCQEPEKHEISAKIGNTDNQRVTLLEPQ